MHNHDCLLSNRRTAGRNIVWLGADDFVVLSELTVRAKELQERGMRYKLAGDHVLAVAVYRELLDTIRKLDEIGAFNWPQGLSTQLVQRAIELEENGGQLPCVSLSQFPPPIQ